MELNYDSFWFGVLMIIGIVFITLGVFFAIKIAYSEELKCLKFNDGKLVVIDAESCYGHYETISWFLSKGYSISGIISGYADDNEIYLTR